MTESIGGAEYLKEHQMIFEQKDYKEDSSYNMELLNYNKEDYEGFKGAEIEAFIIAHDIKNKIDNHYQVFDQNLNSSISFIVMLQFFFQLKVNLNFIRKCLIILIFL